jgi:hypothetical protein
MAPPHHTMDDGELTTETHLITPHGTTTLKVVYTNEESTVEKTLAMYEKWLAGETAEKRFVGLDLEYTRRCPGKKPWPQEMAVVQIAMRNHVLVFHYCRYAIFTFTCRGGSARFVNGSIETRISAANLHHDRTY